ncbi:hypothetical protein BKM31_29890 [[Actinomadura] parvosata subsp. kistnae]|uniref:Uncharacterized protein n=1 Tax=[Actinomadura] parvosata subsp. kistnae TaxID=1909395 RepID=A0A1V0A4F1_9ACTN|nr:hypothetical protein BKM31_29890 [Nonomuraea sp. ATCC 55076]
MAARRLDGGHGLRQPPFQHGQPTGQQHMRLPEMGYGPALTRLGPVTFQHRDAMPVSGEEQGRRQARGPGSQYDYVNRHAEIVMPLPAHSPDQTDDQ